jgi:tellurite resistance protein
LAKRACLSTIGAQQGKERDVAEQAANLRADLILKAMIAVGAADDALDEKEIGLIQQIYDDQSGRSIAADEITRAAETNARSSILAELSAAAPNLDRETKEEIIRAAYLVLLADGRIAGEERKKLQDIAAALRVPEIHFGAILEDLAIWLAGQKT